MYNPDHCDLWSLFPANPLKSYYFKEFSPLLGKKKIIEMTTSKQTAHYWLINTLNVSPGKQMFASFELCGTLYVKCFGNAPTYYCLHLYSYSLLKVILRTIKKEALSSLLVMYSCWHMVVRLGTVRQWHRSEQTAL